MASMHPVTWARPLNPTDLATGHVAVVEGGAQAAGSRADALVVADLSEQERRKACGLAEVTSLGLLDALMNLPLRTPVRIQDVSADVLARFAAAPGGVVELAERRVPRLLTPPLTVVAAIVSGTGWRRPFGRLGHFAAFAQQIVILDREPTRGSSVTWEAQLAGIGVWVSTDGQVTELVAPAQFARLYLQPVADRRRLPHLGIIDLAQVPQRAVRFNCLCHRCESRVPKERLDAFLIEPSGPR